MTTVEMLSVNEVNILKEHDKGLNVQEISEKLHITIEDVQNILEDAVEKRRKLQERIELIDIPLHIRVVDDRIGIPQTGTMKVGSPIIKFLSEGIYSTPGGSIKELISNSYDADAKVVKINTQGDKLIIHDDGEGMGWREFDRDFTFIGVTAKRKVDIHTTNLKRPKIGFLGIGFLSTFMLCNKLKIVSCKKDSDIVFEANIDFSKYRDITAEEQEFYKISDYVIINKKKEEYDIPIDQSFTRIELIDLLPGFKNMLNDKKPFTQNPKTLMEIIDKVIKNKIGISDLGSYWQILLDISMISPVKYLKNGPVRNSKDKILVELKKDIQGLDFSVYFDDIELYKPFEFPFTPRNYMIHTFKQNIQTSDGPLSYKGYIYSQHRIIHPKEFIGLIIRVKNVAIGGIDSTLLGYSSSLNQIFRNWIFGEIYITEGLENSMNINRNKFKTSDIQYMELKNIIHRLLNDEVFKYAREEFYEATRKKKNITDKLASREYNQNIVKNENSNLSLKWRTLNPIVLTEFDSDKKEIILNENNYTINKLPTKEQYLVERILILLELSVIESKGNIIEMKALFSDKIRKWLKPPRK